MMPLFEVCRQVTVNYYYRIEAEDEDEVYELLGEKQHYKEEEEGEDDITIKEVQHE